MRRTTLTNATVIGELSVTDATAEMIFLLGVKITPGYAGDWIDPPCGPEVDILSVRLQIGEAPAGKHGPRWMDWPLATVPQSFYDALLADVTQQMMEGKFDDE